MPLFGKKSQILNTDLRQLVTVQTGFSKKKSL